MASGSLNDDHGLFGPDSMIWRVNREAVVILAGTCAILKQFDSYLEGVIDGGEVRVQEDAVRMGRLVLQPRFRGVPQMAFSPLRSITAGLLPAPLRQQYGLRWGRAERALFAVCRNVFPK